MSGDVAKGEDGVGRRRGTKLRRIAVERWDSLVAFVFEVFGELWRRGRRWLKGKGYRMGT